MAVDFLEEIYQEANLIFEFKKMLRYAQSQQDILLTNTWEQQAESVVSFSKRTLEWDQNLGAKIWNEINVIRESILKHELSSIADGIEELIPVLYEAMALRGTIDVSEGDYRLYSSKGGFLCVQNLRTGKKSLSDIDPAFEAYNKAKLLCDCGKTTFCTLGAELGYLAWQMFEASDRSMDIYIYESDAKKIEYAREYGVLDWIPEEKLHIVIKDKISALMDDIIASHLATDNEETTVFFVENDFYEGLQGQDKTMADIMLQKSQTYQNYIEVVERNFYHNYRVEDKFITELDVSRYSKEWIVVGGGPSVNYNIDYLKEMSGKKVIVAATTILKRLLDEGIKPDFIVAIDMQRRTFGHLEGLEDLDIPLLVTDCVNWMFTELYKGEKYLIPTDGLFFSSVVYKAKGIEPWPSRGTVTATAVEIAARCGAEIVELIGLDFAYPENASHAEGTMDNTDMSNSAREEVPSVCGGMVRTDATLKSYIQEVEEIIGLYKGVRFRNLSKYGALIHGCED